MSDVQVISNVRAHRAAAGLSQSELAERVGVSRQALSAIEAGRQVPSTALALRLARTLGCAVDGLFRLAGGQVVRARLARSGRRRVAIGRVDGGLVAHPVSDPSRPADGVVVGAPLDGVPELDSAKGRPAVSVELCVDPTTIDGHLLVAGCAPLLGALAGRLGQRYRDVRATWIPADSATALDLLARRTVHVAGLHLADSVDPEAHVRAARSLFPDQPTALINLARWRQGLVVAPSNPLGIQTGSGLWRPELRFATRGSGAGAQRLLERSVRADGEPPAGLLTGSRRAADHAEVGRLVRWGVVDVGVAIESVAAAEGLHFIPLAEESFDLLVPAARLGQPRIARFLDLLGGSAFRAEGAGLPGYDLSRAGQVSMVTAA